LSNVEDALLIICQCYLAYLNLGPPAGLSARLPPVRSSGGADRWEAKFTGYLKNENDDEPERRAELNGNKIRPSSSRFS